MGHKDNRKRNLSISLSDEEYDILQEKVAASGLMKTKYCRKVLLDGNLTPGNDASLKVFHTQIKPIGRNLNAVYMALMKNGATPSVIAKLEYALEDFVKLANDYYSRI